MWIWCSIFEPLTCEHLQLPINPISDLMFSLIMNKESMRNLWTSTASFESYFRPYVLVSSWTRTASATWYVECHATDLFKKNLHCQSRQKGWRHAMKPYPAHRNGESHRLGVASENGDSHSYVAYVATTRGDTPLSPALPPLAMAGWALPPVAMAFSPWKPTPSVITFKTNPQT